MNQKFLDTETLEKSYESLEKEFTKKCQELSQIKQEFEEFKAKSEEKPVVEELKEVEKTAETTLKEQSETTEENHDYGVEFRSKAVGFLAGNPDAKNLSKEISKILLLNPELRKLSDPFSVAYAIALKEKNQMKFENSQVLSEKIVEKPQEPTEKSFIPPILSKTISGGVAIKTKPKFSSLEDAREELIRRYFG